MNFSFLPLAISLILAFATLQQGFTAPIRIMPIGDSITAGYTDNPASGQTGGWTVPFEFGYRRQLYQRLSNAGYDFVFVGASPEPWVSVYGDPTHGGTVNPTFDLRPIGQDGHRGYGGIRIPQINTNIASYLNADNPDFILMMIGINGMDSGSPAELATLVNAIFTTKPGVHLILAQITPMSSNVTYATKNADLVSYNTYIRNTLVPSLLLQGRKISTIDQYKNFLTNPNDTASAIDASLYSNGINHPTNAAYDTMAKTWFDGLLAVTPPTLPVLDQTTITLPVAPGTTLGNFAQPPSPSTETLSFSLIAGLGNTDNAKFTISGSLLKSAGHDFSGDPNGKTYSIRVKATGNSGGQTGERAFTLTVSSNPDSDNDSIPDAWETSKAGNLRKLNLTGDFDLDGLADTAEYNLSLDAYPNIDPTNPDTDADGLKDGEETTGTGQRPATNPTLNDTDGDDVCDLNEDNTGTYVSILKTGTNPTVTDSDGDMTGDGAEILQNTNPTDNTSPTPATFNTVSSATTGIYAGNISNTDLLQGLTGTNAVHTGWYTGNSASPSRLNDGLHGGYGTNPVEGAWSNPGSVTTYTLPAGTGNGWNLTNITTIADWSGGGFGNQRFELSIRKAGETTFDLLATVNFQPYTATGVGASKVQITRTGSILAGGVAQIRFSMLSTNGNGGRAVYREFDVFGTQAGGPPAAESAPPLEILTLVPPANGISQTSVTWRSYPGKTYKVENSENLSTWSVINPTFPSGGVTSTFKTNAQSTSASRSFFRVSANP